MITTETKTFDTGVMRLLGLSSSGFIAMILIQAVAFVIPAIICAYICSYPSLYYIYKKMFKDQMAEAGISFVPGWKATLEAIGVGLFIPALSSIIPIQRALAKTLSDSLNTARSTLSGTVVVIQDKSVRVIPFIVFGLLFVLFGTVVYIVLPHALLTENLGIILDVFFAILFSLIFGLTLLVANLRGFIEGFMTYILFFWEKKSMRTLIRKNLVAHKHTNKLTSIIYALTLGCVIFLCVSLTLVLKQTQGSSGGVAGAADIVVQGDTFYEEFI